MRRILLAVSGLSPQVITETIYALYLQGRTPDAIRIITTREGKSAIHANLLSPADGHYYSLLKDYGIPAESIDFSARHLHVATDQFGAEYDDIAGEEENERFLALCMEHAFEATRDPDTEVFFSIAGGRKTMGACLAVAAQCYARPQDRIFHVLVTPEFESNRDFYYPPPISVPLVLIDHKNRTPYTKETRYAQVTLIPLPFFSIRDRLTNNHLKQAETPASLMLSLVREKRGEMILDLKNRKISWKGRELDMMPARLAIYAFFAFLKKEADCHGRTCPGCESCTLTINSVLDKDSNIAELYRKHLAPYRDHDSRHSGAECLTVDGVRNIKIMGKQREFTFGPHSTTLWLAGDSNKAASNLLPFGWVALEVLDVDPTVPLWPERTIAVRAEQVAAAPAVTPPPPPPERITWNAATLSWNPGNQTLIAQSDGKKAEVKLTADTSLVPEALHKKLFVKKDAVKADVVVEQQGNAWRIVGVT